MGIGNIGWTEFLIILAIALIFFGPRRLPGIAQALGRSLREFQKALNEVKSEIAQAGKEADTGPELRKSLPDIKVPPGRAARPLASDEPAQPESSREVQIEVEEGESPAALATGEGAPDAVSTTENSQPDSAAVREGEDGDAKGPNVS